MSRQPQVTCCTCDLSIICVEKCLIAKPEIPSPLDHGWEMNENETISIKWNAVKPAPEEILELMFCNWSKRCLRESCSCIQMDYSVLMHAPK